MWPLRRWNLVALEPPSRERDFSPSASGERGQNTRAITPAGNAGASSRKLARIAYRVIYTYVHTRTATAAAAAAEAAEAAEAEAAAAAEVLVAEVTVEAAGATAHHG